MRKLSLILSLLCCATSLAGQTIPTTDWKLLSADSQASGFAASAAFDGSNSTFWCTQFNPSAAPFPHEIQIDMGATNTLTGFTYLPRQDGNPNGIVAGYEFYVSNDSANWSVPVAAGKFLWPWPIQLSAKTVNFPSVSGRYIRFRALGEINNGPWTTIAELTVLGAAGPPPPYVFQLQGGPKVTFPMTSPPACTPADGTCSITIQISAPVGTVCTTDSTGTICTGAVGTLSLVKSVTLPVPQTQTIPVAVASP
jgi:hypothetical protein